MKAKVLRRRYKTTAGLLDGVKVIAFDQVVALPATTAVLADWGAEVIKIEPLWGDWQRSLVSFNRTPLIIKTDKGEIELHFELLNRNKKSVALNLRTETGIEVLHRLLQDADMFVTNYSVDVLEKFGLTYVALKDKFPRLIHCLLTGYGTKGPKAKDRGYDYVAAWSYGGPMGLVTADPDIPPAIQRPGMMDMVAAAHMTGGICAALYYRQKTGRGQAIELSLYHTAAWTIGLDVQINLYGYPPKIWDRTRNPNPMYNSYKAKDRWMMMVHPNQEYWAPFCKAIGKEEWIDDPRYNTMAKRDKHAEEIIKELDVLFATRTWAEWEESFKKYDLIASGNHPIPEILEDVQAHVNNFFTDIEHPIMGQARLLNSPVQFSETPAKISRVAPQLGAHTEEVLLGAGYSWQDLEEMKEQKVIP
jgi:crotonobetainyl-CoA:carnitine CoA-transferase CaiB-like acyl-CoA transferase